VCQNKPAGGITNANERMIGASNDFSVLQSISYEYPRKEVFRFSGLRPNKGAGPLGVSESVGGVFSGAVAGASGASGVSAGIESVGITSGAAG
jgi:hypothetical protein